MNGGACVKENTEINIDIKKAALWDTIRNKSQFLETQMDPLERKRTGSYFTALELTDVMMQELVSYILKIDKDITELKFLEPCVGTGNFVFSYLKEISKLQLHKEQIETLINNIYVADINQTALLEYKKLLSKFAKLYFDIDLSEEYFNSHIGSALLIDVAAEQPEYIKITDVFPDEVVKEGFDIVVTNPPYKNLKAEKGQYSNDLEYEIDRARYAEIKKMVKRIFNYSTDGVLNLYKLFVEEIIDKYANPNGFVSLLIPSSILTDKTCTKLRTHMLVDSNILSIKMINEGSGYIDAQQALSAILIQRGKRTESIKVTKDYSNNPNQITDINIEDILNENTGNAIFAINNHEYFILKQLRKFPVVKDLDFIINLRGELDLTANKDSIVNIDTGYPLLRGRNIGYYEILDTCSGEFVSKDFIENSKKSRYIKEKRIVCQQVVNMKKERRVTFALVEENYVLGNSCNFISVMDNDYNIDLYAILGLFNTSIINWLFKLTSSNNHVNNYEIDCFPVPIGSPYLNKISNLVKKYLSNKDSSLLEKIEEYAYIAYGIREAKEDNEDKDDIANLKETNDIIKKYYSAIKHVLPSITLEDSVSILEGQSSIESFILQSGVELDKYTRNIVLGITDKYMKIKKGEILNHTTFKLSDLDLEMIRSVPPGGNWKDIPIETVKKSKRLMRITETGGRTTLYGRIDYDKPSYTITTYFNRPGNGTYVHPVHDRVLFVREAARFQCFKDDYYFYGNKTQMLKQVGNAVPTILAYQIAKKIVDKTGCRKSIDLFCGAGGLTAGFKEAGIQSVLCNDIEESACITLKINNPEIKVLCGDISQHETKEHIVNVAINEDVDIICGGPPCQGFSMAGLRLTDDPRNQLFKEFIEIVSRVKPKVIVFENVEGILSFQSGKVYRAILEMFSEIGYFTEGRTLMSSDYAVPQKRKRVFIICTRDDMDVKPADLFPTPITEEPECQITARDTIKDLENIQCDEKACYVKVEHESDILKVFKGKMTYQEYISIHTKTKKRDTKHTLISEDKYGQLTLSIGF